MEPIPPQNEVSLPTELWICIARYLNPSCFYGTLPRISKAFKEMVKAEPLYVKVELYLTPKDPDVLLSKFEVEVQENFTFVDKRLPPIGINVFAHTSFIGQTIQYNAVYEAIAREFREMTRIENFHFVFNNITTGPLEREADALKHKTACITFTNSARERNPPHVSPVLRVRRWASFPWFALHEYLPARHDVSIPGFVMNVKTLELDLIMSSRESPFIDPSRFDGLGMLWTGLEELRIGTRVSFSAHSNLTNEKRMVDVQPVDNNPVVPDTTIHDDDNDENWVDEDVPHPAHPVTFSLSPHPLLPPYHFDEENDDGWDSDSGSGIISIGDNDNDDDELSNDDDMEDDDSDWESDNESDSDTGVGNGSNGDAMIIAKRRKTLLRAIVLDQLVEMNKSSAFSALTTLEINFPLERADHLFNHIIPYIPSLRRVYLAFGVTYTSRELGSTEYPPLESLGWIQDPSREFFREALLPSIHDLAIQFHRPDDKLFEVMVEGLAGTQHHLKHLRIQILGMYETRGELCDKVSRFCRGCVDKCRKELNRFTLEMRQDWLDENMHHLTDLKRDLKHSNIAFELVKLPKPVYYAK
ncbi:hypothetical protein SmJEL517_g04862 [Synchytrium microbalum]|uniref:F-box domain-containing protein n=1 Tax=Synchytrium microbalum TaxID=1806994 RepID=A0A507C352_9FUNG|nr:uncharacterized protein SmJEL517_g04862 [Synchytrium microbalum]TPX31943.1 hypothetical protein SmJEL517_g04862 [Synchytrium microbalum]